MQTYLRIHWFHITIYCQTYLVQSTFIRLDRPPLYDGWLCH